MSEEMIEFIKYCIAAFLLLGFFYFIIIRAINTKNYIRKSFYIFICGLVIFLFFIGGIIFDVIKGLKFENILLSYFAFPIVSFLLMAFFTIFYFIKGYKYKQTFKSKYTYKTKQDLKPTIKNKKENLYIILKYNNNFLLKRNEEKEEVYYNGIVVKFPHNEFFHDELVTQYIEKNQLDVISYNQIGKATKREKDDIVYYCYKILLNTIPNISDLEEIDSYKLVSMNLKEMDKKIIFTSVVENDFDIEIK